MENGLGERIPRYICHRREVKSQRIPLTFFSSSAEEVEANTRSSLQREPDGSIYDILDLEGDAIRLLELLPGVGNERVQCRLLVSPDTASLPYEALSYVWGNPKSQSSITINGAPYQITPNLHSALQCLRLKESPRILWTDALCINQSNKAEKAIQVARMGDIYKFADRVVIHLGPGDEESSMLFDFIEAGVTESKDAHPLDHVLSLFRMASASMQDMVAQLKTGTKGGELRSASSQNDVSLVPTRSVPQGPSSEGRRVIFEGFRTFQSVAAKRGFEAVPILHAFVDLLFRPWWTRAWIAQEICLAQRDPWVYCGSRWIPASTLTSELNFLMPLILEATNSVKGPLASKLPPGISTARLGERMASASNTLKNRGLNYALPLRVFYQQTFLSTRDCGDPRDRIFAYRSLLDPIYQDICYPDYQAEKYHVYKKNATWILGFEGYGEVLCKFRLGKFPEFPESWVPDFSAPFTIQGIERIAESEYMCIHKGTLAATCLLFDRIKTTRKISASKDVDLVQELWRFEQETWSQWDEPTLDTIYAPQPLLEWSLFSLGFTVDTDLVSWLLPSSALTTELSLFWEKVMVDDSSRGRGSVPARETDGSGTISVSETALQATKKIASMAEFSGCVLFDYQHFCVWLDTARSSTSDLSPSPSHSTRPRYRCDKKFYHGAMAMIMGMEESHYPHRQQTCTLLLILADRIRDMVFPDPHSRRHRDLWPTLGKAASVDGPLSFKYGHPETIRLVDMETATIARRIKMLESEELEARASDSKEEGREKALQEIIAKRQGQEFILEKAKSELSRDNHVADLKRKELLHRLRDRQWFVTDSGTPGVGVDQQDGFEPGDIVSLVASVSLPMVIRRVNGTKDLSVHRFVGPARVRGLIGSKGFKKVENLK